MSNFSFEPLKLKLATNNIIIPMQNGVADLTNAETSAKIMLAGKELFPVFDERIGGRNLFLDKFYVNKDAHAPSLNSNNDARFPRTQGDDEIGRWVSGHDLSTGKFRISTYISSTFSNGVINGSYSKELDVSKIKMQSVEVMCDTAIAIGIFLTQGDYTLLEPNVWTKIYTVIDSNIVRPSGLYTPATDIPLDTKLYHRNWNLVHGNKIGDWTPAPEDVLQLATLSSYNCSAAIVGDLVKITSHKPETTRGWVDVTVNYGNLSNTKRLNWSVEGVEPYKPTGTLLTMNNRGIKY